ncbi:hypothetical protein GCM10008967_38440 [Bacillus carboniphilus]|uniref:Uncharacterized protein n=2 Tax=Bacillus carboniphilus TaxID=86663 RepID=A0ABN0WR22_9BACI
MNINSRWVIAVVLILLAILFFNKGLELRALGANVDGDGIGVHFLAFEINDRVPEESIPSYAIGFFISSIVAIIISIILVGMNLKSRVIAS